MYYEGVASKSKIWYISRSVILHLASSINLILKAVAIKTGHIYVNILVFLVNTGHFLIFCAFLKKLKLKEKISNNPFDFSTF